jgi:hypothetical protein
MIDKRCIACFQKTYKRLFHKFKVSESKQNAFLTFFNYTIDKVNNQSTPDIQRYLNRKFCNIVGVHDPFEKEKKSNNKKALELYKVWKPQVLQSENPFRLALRLAIAGNIMDYGARNSFDIDKTINKVLETNFAIDHSELLWERIQKAKKILYLGDNAGEIVFDKLLIETINHNVLTFAVKGGPVLNDVTIIDAEEVGMLNVAKVISNGYDAPSTVLSESSNEFLELYKSADLIISKGQGNLEGLLSESDPRIFFLLMVKCDLIGKILNVKKGSFVTYNLS